MAVDRFIYLKFPLKYPKIVTKGRTIFALAIVWAICLALCFPPLFGFGEFQFSLAKATCTLLFTGSTPLAPNHFYAILLMIEVVIPVVILIIFTTWVFYIIQGSLTRKQRRSVKNFTYKEYTRGQLRLVLLFVALLVARSITWLPLGILTICGAVLGTGRIHPLGFTITFLSILSEVVIHPAIEVCLLRDIKMTISGCFLCCKEKISCAEEQAV